jgi:hypothetical protein
MGALSIETRKSLPMVIVETAHLPLRCARLFGVLLRGGHDVLSIERVGVAFHDGGQVRPTLREALRPRRIIGRSGGGNAFE